MKCHVCGAVMKKQRSDMPFKTKRRSIIIVKGVPVLQCGGCREYLLEDAVMEHIERLLEDSGKNVELEIVRYAA